MGCMASRRAIAVAWTEHIGANWSPIWTRRQAKISDFKGTAYSDGVSQATVVNFYAEGILLCCGQTDLSGGRTSVYAVYDVTMSEVNTAACLAAIQRSAPPPSWIRSNDLRKFVLAHWETRRPRELSYL